MKRLTKAEEEIMQLIWEHGPTTVSALIEHMNAPKPPHSSISSIVRILEKKGFVDHKAYGRTYEYFPIIQKSDYSKFSIKKLVTQYFEGSMNELVSFLVKEDDISLDDLKELTKKFDNQNDDKIK
ncbi:MAG: BlaI/MecI/CopY family transcriptional regulator [Bacteroidota bacterium]